MESIHFISLGCSKNLVDSEVMLGALLKAGYTLALDPARAEIIIVNTCSFVDDAKKEAIDTILDMARYKEQGECKKLIVAGCLSQRYKEKLLKLLPEVDHFVGVGEIANIADIIKNPNLKSTIYVGSPNYLYDHLTPRLQLTRPYTAYVKIADGCSNKCSYCVIPQIRGEYRGRKISSVVSEVKGFLKSGVKEINLIAQDTTFYGNRYKTKGDLIELLNRLMVLEYKKWIRLMYAYPTFVSKELLDLLVSQKGLVPYLDVPIQHASDKILTAMHRRGSKKELSRLFELIKKYYKGLFLRTSVMVGFPGEGKSEFKELVDFINEFEFDHLGCFVFSPQEGTPAASLKGKVQKKIAHERQKEIMEVQKDISRKKLKRLVGTIIEVICEGKTARHAGQAPEVDGVVKFKGEIPPEGRFVKVKIISASDYDLVGEVI